MDEQTYSEQVYLTTRADPDLRRQLEELARANERTLSQEIRLAAREHLARHKEDHDGDSTCTDRTCTSARRRSSPRPAER